MQGFLEGWERRVAASKLRVTVAFAVLVALIAVALVANSSAAGPSGLQQAITIQEENTDRLLSRGVIVGTGVGVDSSGSPEIVVLAKRQAQVAHSLGGVPVELKVTGPISSLRLAAPRKKPENPGGGGGHHGGGGETESSLSPTDRFDRPVPIGVSTGNAGECSAGTIGARVKGGGGVYSLSNNHVYALENDASVGSAVLQPGRYDTGCSSGAGNEIGALSNFVEISFSASAANEVDAAIASTSVDDLGNATPSNGYGTPAAETVSAVPGAGVQKYGRTTEETHGVVTATSGVVKIGYSKGTAQFVNQIFVESRKPFIKAGDSGSLLVTDNDSANPVGLLFAGDGSGKFAVANRIDTVLTRLGVTIDGK
jgi:hypothetical protein